MSFFIRLLMSCILSFPLFAAPDKVQLAVWANEAIVATYTFDHEHFLEQQKAIAKFYSAKGWIDYSNALNDSGIPDKVKANAYSVSAVVTAPPNISLLAENHWKATMPLLVLYKNPQSQQKQNLEVAITFETAASGQGVRGLAITSINSTLSEAACECVIKK